MIGMQFCKAKFMWIRFLELVELGIAIDDKAKKYVYLCKSLKLEPAQS